MDLTHCAAAIPDRLLHQLEPVRYPTAKPKSFALLSTAESVSLWSKIVSSSILLVYGHLVGVSDISVIKVTIGLTDGGGPRVISQLLIVDGIMNRIQWDLKLEEVPRPCNYAELMVGTELGAYVHIALCLLNTDLCRVNRVIVILLARLRLTAREALGHIVKLGQRVFTEPIELTSGPKYKPESLNVAVRAILNHCGLDEDAKMIESVVHSGLTYAYVTFAIFHYQVLFAAYSCV